MVFVDTSWNYFLTKTLHLQGRKDGDQKSFDKKIKTSFNFFLQKLQLCVHCEMRKLVVLVLQNGRCVVSKTHQSKRRSL